MATLATFSIDELKLIHFPEDYEHISSYKHAGRWNRGSDQCWLAVMSNYRSAKEQDRVFISNQDDELRADTITVGMILERGQNYRQSGNYGQKLRSFYVIHSIDDNCVVSTLHETPNQAFKFAAQFALGRISLPSEESAPA